MHSATMLWESLAVVLTKKQNQNQKNSQTLIKQQPPILGFAGGLLIGDFSSTGCEGFVPFRPTPGVHSAPCRMTITYLEGNVGPRSIRRPCSIGRGAVPSAPPAASRSPSGDCSRSSQASSEERSGREAGGVNYLGSSYK